MYIAGTERFVKEYGNYKIRMYKDLAKSFPEKKEHCDEMCDKVRAVVRARERGLITADECMSTIAGI